MLREKLTVLAWPGTLDLAVRDIPIMIATAMGETDNAQTALELGRQDFATQPGDGTERVVEIRALIGV